MHENMGTTHLLLISDLVTMLLLSSSCTTLFLASQHVGVSAHTLLSAHVSPVKLGEHDNLWRPRRHPHASDGLQESDHIVDDHLE